MDPLTIFGVAVNIVQLVDFSARLLREASNLHRSATGQKEEHVELQLVAESLTNMCARTSATLVSSAISGVVGTEIASISKAAEAVAKELLAIIRKLQGPTKLTSHRSWRSFRQALATMWKQDKIEGLQRRLDELRSQLQVILVAHISSEQAHITTDLAKLRTQCESINPRRLKAIEEAIRQVRNAILPSLNTTVLEDIGKLLSRSRAAQINLYKEGAVLQSLRFSTMPDRSNSITDAHQTTFEWLFKPDALSSSDPRSQIQYKEWLLTGDGVFWIAGKPGSGKSTLMKYLYNCGRTRECLEAWAGQSRLAMAAFYFWMAGSDLQRSQLGLLRQLLFEILRENPDLIPQICKKHWENQQSSMQPWSLVELHKAFEQLDTIGVDMKFCLFIDALDEYDGDHLDLIKILKTLARISSIKLCVASRPWPQFSEAFGKTSDRKLRLEDLTRDDIRRFTCDKLMESPESRKPNRSGHKYTDLVEEITSRAQGVFLWVFLVVRSLREGLSNGDSPALLKRRLDDIPTDLEKFFEKILKSVNRVYQPQMALTFQMAIRAPEPINVVSYYLLDESNDQSCGSTASSTKPRHHDIAEIELTMRKRLNGRYKGLLEVSGNAFERQVHFLHRTVRDYLKTGNAFSMFVIPDLNPCSKVCRAFLDYCEIFGYEASFGYVTLENFMIFARWAEENNESFDLKMATRMLEAADRGTFFRLAVLYGFIPGLKFLESTQRGMFYAHIDQMISISLEEPPSLVKQLFRGKLGRTFAWLYRNLDWGRTSISASDLFVNFLSCTKAYPDGLKNCQVEGLIPYMHHDWWIMHLGVFLDNGVDINAALGHTKLQRSLPWLGKGDPLHSRSEPAVEPVLEYLVQAYTAFLCYGLDPNLIQGSQTVWQAWLRFAWRHLERAWKLRLVCIKAIKVLLAYGADVNATVIEFLPLSQVRVIISVQYLLDKHTSREHVAELRSCVEDARRYQQARSLPIQKQAIVGSKRGVEESQDYGGSRSLARRKRRHQ